MTKASDNLFPGIIIRESADDGSDFSNPSADYRRLFLGEDGQLHVKDSAGSVTTISGSALGAWTDYTPTWGAGTPPTLGSTTIEGRYKELDSTTLMVQICIAITTGGAWNAGSGTYTFTLPGGYTAASAQAIQLGSAHVLDSGTAHYAGVCKVASGGTTINETVIADGTGSRTLTHNTPITWATGDQINLAILIETT